MANRKLTMQDISRASGLSTFAVSRALNGGAGVSEESRALVKRIAKELGYVPNRAAQDLRGGGSGQIALITAGTANSYYLDLMTGIQQTTHALGQEVVLMDIALNGAYDPELEDRVIQRLLEARMAGVISTLTLKDESIAQLSKWDIPLVFVDSTPPEGAAHLPSVTSDNYAASRIVGQHLTGHGLRDWLFLVYPERWSSRWERERGLRDAAQLGGALLTVLESENDSVSAKRTLAAYFDARAGLPDVLIAGNNPLLLGALKLMRDRGLSVPRDMALVGYDEFAWASLIDPPLTVLDERSEEIGRLAAKTLMSIIDAQSEAKRRGESAAPVYLPEHKLQVPVDLLIRLSCGCTPQLG